MLKPPIGSYRFISSSSQTLSDGFMAVFMCSSSEMLYIVEKKPSATSIRVYGQRNQCENCQLVGAFNPFEKYYVKVGIFPE